jgi:hypothetical protein
MRRAVSLALLSMWFLVSGCGPDEAAKPSVPPSQEATGFVDRTDHAGFHFVNHTGKPTRKDYIVESKGGGGLCLDYDRDGDIDLYVVDGNTYETDAEGNVVSRTSTPEARNRLLRNDGGWRFTDVTEEAGVGDRSYGFGGGVGDFDNDGFTDIYVCNWGPNVLYRNNGDGTFTDVTTKAGVAGHDSYYSTGAAFFDADRDGDLDLYVSNYNDIGAYIRYHKGRGQLARYRGMAVFDGPLGIPPVPDLFFRNNGDGTFADETATALRNQDYRYAFTSAVSDLDNDGDLDVYTVADVCKNTLWINDGTGHFDDRGEQAGVAADSEGALQAGMGNEAADFDQDGWIDLFVTNFEADKNTLYRNESARAGTPFFEDVTERTGISREDYAKVCWANRFADFNLDGILDAFVVAGHVYEVIDRFADVAGVGYRQTPSLYHGDGPPRWSFTSVTAKVGGEGLRIPKVGRGACFADFDDDGDIDVFISALNERPLLLENRLPREGNFLMLDLAGRSGDRDAIGARATVRAGTIRQMHEKRVSGSFLSTNDPRLHWGVGNRATVDELTVRWFTSGREQTFRDVPANHSYRLVEGGELERLR